MVSELNFDHLPHSAHVGYIGRDNYTPVQLCNWGLFVWIRLTSLFSTCTLYKDRQSLLTGHNAFFLRKIARDILHALPQRHDNTWTAFGEQVVPTGGDKLITC